MRLAIRLVGFLVLTLAALVAVDGYLEYTQGRELILDGMSRRARALGKSMSGVLADVWSTFGMGRVQELIADANESQSDIRIRWVWLEAEAGDPAAPQVASRTEVASSLRTGALVDHLTTPGGRLYAYFPVSTDRSRLGALEISQSVAELSERSARSLRWLATRLIAVFLVAAVTVYFIGARFIGRPLAKLNQKIDRIGLGDLSGPLELRDKHELTQLAAGLNTMCERLLRSQAEVAEQTAAKIAAIDQARHADRLRTVGQLASGVAHELGTPMNVVSGRAALIVDDKLDGSKVRESAEIIAAQADRMTKIIRQLLTFARRGPPTIERVDLQKAVRQTIAMVESMAKKKSVTLDLSVGTGGEKAVDCSASALQQVLTNLIVNAIQASPSGNAVQVNIGTESTTPPDSKEADARQYVRVEVRDTGEGIEEERLLHVFEPFFTTKEVGEGTGLGLSIVHAILQDSGGWIDVTSKPAEGSCFTFYLPASQL